MWAQISLQRNRFLHSNLKEIEPAFVNETLEHIYRKKSESDSSINYKLGSVKFSTGRSSDLKFDITKSRLAYGIYGLPRVIKQICSSNEKTVFEALHLLRNLLTNPLEYDRAVQQFDVVKRLEDCFFRNVPKNCENVSILKILMKNLVIISTHYNGAERMISQYNLIDSIFQLIILESSTSFLCAKILENLSVFRMVAEKMLYYNHLGKLKEIFDSVEQSSKLVYLYTLLSNLIAISPRTAVDNGYYEFLLQKIICNAESKSPKLQAIGMKCFALILNCPEARERFESEDGIRLLYDLLKSKELSSATLQYVALAMQICTISKKSLWRCREFWDLPLVLIQRAYTRDNKYLQLYSMQILRQITVFPSIKNFIRHVCKLKIQKIPCHSAEVRQAKDCLMQWIHCKVYLHPRSDHEDEGWFDKFEDLKSDCNFDE